MSISCDVLDLPIQKCWQKFSGWQPGFPPWQVGHTKRPATFVPANPSRRCWYLPLSLDHPTRSQQFSASSKLTGQLDISLNWGYIFATSWWYFTSPTDKFKVQKMFLDRSHISEFSDLSLSQYIKTNLKGPRQMALLPLVTVITSADLGSIAVPPGLIHIFSRGSLQNRLICDCWFLGGRSYKNHIISSMISQQPIRGERSHNYLHFFEARISQIYLSITSLSL